MPDERMRNEAEHVLARIWEALAEATTQRTGFTRAVLATATVEGQPRARSVIVRDFTKDPERIALTTDIRSAKVAEIHDNQQVSLVFYDEATSVQCRAEGIATVIPEEPDNQTLLELSAWISIELQALDWLDLSDEPHQRWQFVRRRGTWQGQPVAP